MKQKIKKEFSRLKKIMLKVITLCYVFLRCRYTESLGKINGFRTEVKRHIQKGMAVLLDCVDRNHEKSSWVNIAGLAADALGFVAYRILSPIIAEYQNTEKIRTISLFVIWAIIIIGIWEILSLTGTDWLRWFGGLLARFKKKVANLFWEEFRQCPRLFRKMCKYLVAVVIISSVFICEFPGVIICQIKRYIQARIEKYPWLIKAMKCAVAATIICTILVIARSGLNRFEKPEITYYKSIGEVYGIPVGTGEPLRTEELEKCEAYWKIEEYPRQKRMVLTFMEPYQSLELMEQYSTLYGMAFFHSSARIEIKYTTDQAKYKAMSQEIYEAARNNKFRELAEISYYNSSEQLTMQLVKNKYGKFEFTFYSSQDMPQLYNSTLLRIPEGQMIENDMTSQQIEITYNTKGLPKTRRLSPYIYNFYGVNGEYYDYDQHNRLSSLYYIDINGEFICNKLGIMRIDFQYEDDGSLHSIRYYSDQNRTKKTEGFQGVFCEKFSYDSQGRLFERYQQDRNENLRCDVNGVCIYRYHYGENEQNRLTEEEFFGFSGEPVRNTRYYDTHVMFDEVLLEEGLREFRVSTDVSHFPFGIKGNSASGNEETKDFYVVSGQNDLQEAYYQQISQIDFPSQYDQQDNPDIFGEQYSHQEDLNILPKQYYDWEGNQTTSRLSINDTWIHVEEEADIIHNYASIYYTINYDGKIISISYHDDMGELMENEEGYAVKHLEYDDDDERLEYERYFNAEYMPCLINDGYGAIEYTYDPEHENEIKTKTFLDISGHVMFNRKYGYASVEYSRFPADKGTQVQMRYLDQNGIPVRIAEQGYAMVDQYYNERNFLVWEAYYNEEEEKMCRTDYGVAVIWYEYDDNGNLIRESYKDVNGHLVNRSDTGYAVIYRRFEGGQMVHCHYDGYYNRMFGNVMDKTTGVASIEYHYDGGLKTMEEYYDTKGNLVLRNDIGCAVQEFEYNDNGRVCAEYYYGSDRKPVLRRDTGYAVIKYRDNEDGQRNGVYFYGTDGELIVSSQEHCAGISYEYDENKNSAIVGYFGTDGDLMVRNDCNYAQIEIEYDKHGNVFRVAYLDTQGNPVAKQNGGYASYENKYDRGNWIETRYFDEDGILAVRSDTGYAIIKNEYITDDEYEFMGDSNTNVKMVSQIFLDGDGRPIISTKYHCAQIQFTYDMQGNRIDTQYLDTNSMLIIRSDLGYAQMHSSYDDSGRCISVQYYDVYGEPAISKEHCCAGFQYRYDNWGNLEDICYIDQNHELMTRPDLGYAQIHSEYDASGNKIRETFYDLDGELALWKEGGFAFREFTYDNGYCVEERCFDERYQLTLRKNTGCSIIKYQYDGQGNCLSEMYYNTSEQLTVNTEYHCTGRKFAYDEKNRLTDEWYTGWNDDLMLRSDLGYAQIHWEYDEFGNKVSESYFDADGKPTEGREAGNASCKSLYDANSNCIEKRYLDIQGDLVLRSDSGYAIIQFTYDDRGQCISEMYYGIKEQPVVNTAYHCFGRKFAYDEYGNRTDSWHIGIDGKLMLDDDLGVAHEHSEYDDSGNKVKISYYGVNEEPVLSKKRGYAACEYQYDIRGNCMAMSYFDADGKNVLCSDEGYAIAQYEYNAFGQRVFAFYYDVDFLPVINTKYHCAGFQYRYDNHGNQTDIIAIDLDRNLMIRRDLGYAWRHSEYDRLGNEVLVEYRDESGMPVLCHQGGYAYAVYEYDHLKCTAGYYYDTEGNLTLRNDEGYAIIRYSYDDMGNCILVNYRDTQDKPVINSNYSAALFVYDYDEWGNNTYVWYFGEDDEMIERDDMGVVMHYREYDPYGHMLSDEYYAFNPENHTQVQLAIRKDWGYAVIKQAFDGSNRTMIKYLDEEGNLIVPEKIGYALCELEYDDAGQLSRWIYYDDKGNLATPVNDEAAIVERIYDSTGNCVGETLYNKYNEKINERSWVSPIVYDSINSERWRQELHGIKIT